MGMPEFSDKWINTKVEVSRLEFGNIVAEEIVAATKAAETVGDEKFGMIVQELLMNFSATVAARLFGGAGDDENEEV